MMTYVVLCATFLLVLASAGAQRATNRGTYGIAAGTRGARRAVAGKPTCDPKNCVCHGKFGCFRKRNHCQETSAPLPQSPQSIGTSFQIYKRGNRPMQTLSLTMSSTAIFAAGFDSRQPTMIAIHGWTQSPNSMDGLKNMLLKKGDYNVILVDWEKGAGLTGRWPLVYTQPMQNTRVVGKHIAMLISHLQAVTGINPATVHLIGSSLGAQAAGYAGMYMNGTVARISGLDPAKPNFEGQPNDCKLDKSDAQFVDVIHTNMDVAGVAESVGHVDFFPNGGRTQPGCFTPICSHLKAKSYFRSSVWTNCQFSTRRCDGKPCGHQGCPAMGFNAFRPRDHSKGGEFCLTTTEIPPYCTDGSKGRTNSVKPPRPEQPSSGKPYVGTGNDRTTWSNHGKRVQPGWSNGAADAQKQADTFNMNKDTLFDSTNSGNRHQTTIYATAFTLILTAVTMILL